MLSVYFKVSKTNLQSWDIVHLNVGLDLLNQLLFRELAAGISNKIGRLSDQAIAVQVPSNMSPPVRNEFLSPENRIDFLLRKISRRAKDNNSDAFGADAISERLDAFRRRNHINLSGKLRNQQLTLKAPQLATCSVAPAGSQHHWPRAVLGQTCRSLQGQQKGARKEHEDGVKDTHPSKSE